MPFENNRETDDERIDDARENLRRCFKLPLEDHDRGFEDLLARLDEAAGRR